MGRGGPTVEGVVERVSGTIKRRHSAVGLHVFEIHS